MYDNLKDFFNDKINLIKYTSNNENDTLNLAYHFASYLKALDVVALNGELGAGKTTFMSGVARYFNIEDQISSPTFTIVNEYNVYKANKNLNIYHFDTYRITSEEEFIDGIGTDYFSNGICFIEWSKNIQTILPKNTIYIDINKDENDDNIRYIQISRRKS